VPTELLTRRALSVAQRRAQFSRVLIVNGPRQSGKTVLLRMLHESAGGSWNSLDDAKVLLAARRDAGGFVREGARPLFVDEVQRAGNPFILAVKGAVDIDDRPGQFYLAGSTRFLFEPRLSESLAGRALFVDLWPLSQGEIEGAAEEDFVSRAFAGHESLLSFEHVSEPIESRHATMERVCRGGMPQAVRLEGRNRRELLSAYARTLASRDVTEIGRLPTSFDLPTLMRVLAGRTSNELNTSEIARVIGASPDVTKRVVTMLETVYFHYLVPAWSRNLTAKAVRRPKLHITDSGLATALCGVNADALSRPENSVSGAFLESFVVGEVARQLTWSDTEASMFHWRDRDGAEVDILLERPNGDVVGIEVKASFDLHAGDTKGLRALRDRLGETFVAGIVLHCGNKSQRLDDRIIALPISALWSELGAGQS
jgi:uncharacterized protein